MTYTTPGKTADEQEVLTPVLAPWQVAEPEPVFEIAEEEEPGTGTSF
jgi:hypothetical protein